MTRDELIEAGARALTEAWRDGILLTQNERGEWSQDFGKFTSVVLDAVEPLIRADERAKCGERDE